MAHNDVVKLRAGAVQRGANHTGQSYSNPDSTLPARQLQLHVLRHSRLLHVDSRSHRYSAFRLGPSCCGSWVSSSTLFPSSIPESLTLDVLPHWGV